MKLQRFNLIANNEKRRVGKIGLPDLTDLKGRFAARMIALEEQPVAIPMSAAAEKVLDEFTANAKFDDIDPDIKGRLNGIASKNALHLCWLRHLPEIGLPEIAAGIRLAEYQFLVRQRFCPAQGENQLALVEDLIRKFLQRVKKVGRRELQRRIQRFNGDLFNRAIKSLELSGEIQQVTEIGRGGHKVNYVVWIG